MSPLMETLTGIMIAILIFYSGKLIYKNELDINNFFSFLAAMMLAYQPVRALSTLNMIVNQGLSAASKIIEFIDQENKILLKENSKDKIMKSNTSLGKLYLIPITLSNPGETTVAPEDVLPQTSKRTIDFIDTFIVENEKTARKNTECILRYSKNSIHHQFPICKRSKYFVL